MSVSRRGILKGMAAAATVGSVGGLPHGSRGLAEKAAVHLSDGLWPPVLPDRLKRLPIPPLFVTAYITPSAPGQGGQEALVARYPLALVPQDTRREFYTWRNKVKEINPDILLLAYQMVNEETRVPGPGHDRYRALADPFIQYPGGIEPTVGPANKQRRLFDMRKPEWRAAFLQGCKDVMRSYPYDGLFLDNCTVFTAHHPYPWVRGQIREALQDALIELRQMFPKNILIGNSRENWVGLNGEMTETRLRDIAAESAFFPGHAQPEMDLSLQRLVVATDNRSLRKGLIMSLEHGALFGAAVNYQHALWFDEFNQVIRQWKNERF